MKKAEDAFAKAFAFRRADEAAAAGMHPYFKPIASQRGGTVMVNGHEMVITGSNDYLGLTQDPRLKEAARSALDDFGTSCTGSRFLTGTLTLHEELEHRLAEFLGKESALTFSAGYLGCLSVISALAGRHDILYYDRENHASLYDAAKLSFASLRKFEHNDLAGLARLLEQDAGRPGGRIIVTDGVFSMSGHIAKLPELVEIKRRYGARLIVDDAHATGVLGPDGRGTGDHFGLVDEIDVVIGTFSKSLASVGGFMAADRAVVQFVKHSARPFIFTTAPAPADVAAGLAALRIVRSDDGRGLVRRLGRHVDRVRPGHPSPIVPIVLGDEDSAMAAAATLLDAGLLVPAIRPPTVPEGTSRLRVALSAAHTDDEVDRLAFALDGLVVPFTAAADPSPPPGPRGDQPS